MGLVQSVSATLQRHYQFPRRNRAEVLASRRGHSVHELLPAEHKDGLLVTQGQRICLQVCIGQMLTINDYFGILHFDAVRLLLLFRGQGKSPGLMLDGVTVHLLLLDNRRAETSFI
jgi:hypothetical protein